MLKTCAGFGRLIVLAFGDVLLGRRVGELPPLLKLCMEVTSVVKSLGDPRAEFAAPGCAEFAAVFAAFGFVVGTKLGGSVLVSVSSQIGAPRHSSGGGFCTEWGRDGVLMGVR